MPQSNTETSQTNTETSQSLDVLRDDLTRLRSDMGEMLSHLAGESEGQLSAVRDKLKGTGKRAISYSEDTIRERPITSVTILFFVGLIMGWLLDRKMSS